MIGKFLGKARLLVPTAWLNAVVSALNHANSPRGTINVTLDGDGESTNLRMDINPKVVASEVLHELSLTVVSRGNSALLGEGLKWGERGLAIDEEWLSNKISKSLM